MRIDKKCRIGRTYDDYCTFISNHPNINITEMDTVEGKKGGAVLLTILLQNCNFMLAFIRKSNNAQSVIDCFDYLYSIRPNDIYSKLFGVLLTDNGTEFSNPLAIEFADSSCKRSSVFYCDPMSPQQKPKVENNHTLLRLDLCQVFGHVLPYER